MNQRTTTILIISLVLLTPVVTFGASSAGRNFAQMMTTFQSNLPFVKMLVVGFSYTMGVALILNAVFKLKRYGEMRTMMATNMSAIKPLVVMMVGAGLIYLPTLIDYMVGTLYAYGSSSVMEYPTQSDWSQVINPLIQTVKVLGLISFVRGWAMLAKYGSEGGQQPGTAGKSIMHMVGGVLAMNIVGTIDVIKASFGIG
ncbi:MAG: type IV secretion protein IcmC [Coxiellaceae bacterium]|nr:type IV secretion protein IcmC [Coxiellaceae bacterium]